MDVRFDSRGRIRVPKRIRDKFIIRKDETFEISLKNMQIVIERQDPFLKGILERPLHSKRKITRKLLERLEDEQWSGK